MRSHPVSAARRAVFILLAVLVLAVPVNAAGQTVALWGVSDAQTKMVSAFESKGYKLPISGRESKLAALKSKLKKQIKAYDGTFSIYVKDLKTSEYFMINRQQMYAASLVKLYEMGACYQQIRAGQLSEAALENEIRSMIVSSDNWCFNDLVGKTGLKYLNSWISTKGYMDTKVRHGCQPADNGFGEHTVSRYNRTSVRDCGLFLERVYRGKCVSRAYSKKMLALLKDQSRRTKIPAGVPSGVKVANKTGETDDTSHDAAIVFSPGGDYILVVMVTAPGKGWSKAPEIAKISEITYRYFNK